MDWKLFMLGTCLSLGLLLADGCGRVEPGSFPRPSYTPANHRDTIAPSYLGMVVVPHDIRIRQYFSYLQDVVRQNDTIVPYSLNEYILVRANPWIIDSLAETDYYRRAAKGDTVYNQPNLIVLHQGDTIFLPDSTRAAAISKAMEHTWIDVNIPEFRLRIVEGTDTLYSFPVRVGENKTRYLASVGHKVDRRTRTGKGTIIRINRNPIFIEPISGKRYTTKKRDDGVVTRMPQIPWLEPEINGQRYGQMIHPMPNPRTLGKAISNGCIGLNESDAWRFYYHAPLGTPVVIRYDLQVPTGRGDTLLLPDIYARPTKKTALKRQ